MFRVKTAFSSWSRVIQPARKTRQRFGAEALPSLTVGIGVDLTIRELAEAVAASTGLVGESR